MLFCSAYNDFTTTNVNDTAWVQLNLIGPNGSALSPNQLNYHINSVDIENTSQYPVYIGVGGAGNISQALQIAPGACNTFQLILNQKQSVYLRGVLPTTTVADGSFSIGFNKRSRG